ncbi:MAG TPA: Fic family protein [Candidatus Baltobacteraceae bacterium]|nr:Fic family protein [Candidatus Baltobacteraceae bacterium]
MTRRYRTSRDPYLLPGTNVLENKLGITNENELKSEERDNTADRLAELFTKPIDGNFDLAHLQRIHFEIFQDVYEWAGQLRRVDITKGLVRFTSPDNLPSRAAEFFNKLAQERHLCGISKRYFAESAASYFAEVNKLHPFRDGNGRAQREFFRELAIKAGHTIDWSVVHDKKMLAASIEGVFGNIKPIEKIFRQAIGDEVKTPLEWVERKLNRF